MKVDPRAISAYQNTVSLSERAGRVKNASQVAGGKGANGTSIAPKSEDARVTISPEARQLAAGAQADAATQTGSAQASGFDAAKVQALKEKIQNGTLQIDSRAVAQGIIDRTG